MPVLPAAADIRARTHDPLALTPRQRAQLRGELCARCGSQNVTQAAGYAYVQSGPGRLGRPVRVCANCPSNVGG
ncbi:hypothetical protein [Streptomyces virginiae]|uniref:hypothetical protein n=1 Tax=Streptomyces virginiae TaxID=1961 RepID=UPI003682BF94